MRPYKKIVTSTVVTQPDTRVAVYYQSDGMDIILHEEMSESGEVVRRSDVSILLNNKLLEKRNISPLALQRFVDQLRSASSSDLLKGQPDSVLKDIIKSRYIQSPADIYSYNKAIERDLYKLEGDVQDYVRAEQEARDALKNPLPEQPAVEPSKTE